MKPNLIYKEILNDGLTPILVYRALGGIGCCMLESAHEKGEGKMSAIGIHPIGTFRSNGRKIETEIHGIQAQFEADPYEALKVFAQDRRAFGFITYDAVRVKENLPDRHPSKGIPDFFFHLYRTVITFDHEKQKIICIHEGSQEELDAILAKAFEPTRLQPFQTPKKISVKFDLSDPEFVQLVEMAKEYIRAGDIFQVVLSRTAHVSSMASPFDIYRAMRQVTPATYLFFFEEQDFAIAGASPELLISVENGKITSMPIAGTSPKDKCSEELLSDPKECAEHVMLVDLARNDIGAVAKPGTVCVAEYKYVKSFSHVKHILSRVVGELHDSFHALDALKASFPAGTLSGAPKIRAMEIIDELENSKRGLYGGAIVSLDEKGNLMSCIAIRMAYIQGSNVEVRAGAGIVLDSQPEKEAAETEHKMKGILEALALAEGGAI